MALIQKPDPTNLSQNRGIVVVYNKSYNSMDTSSRIKEVLEAAYLMSLGISDENGPWVSDVIFVFDEDFNIYWMSYPATRHSKAIVTNNKAAASITAVGGIGIKGLGVQMEGVAEKIAGARYDLTQKLFEKKNQPVPPEDEDVLDGDSWYVLKPSQILLIDEANFGFKRQPWKN
jgi:uncharacterized protein YhbP (UPF0306 family)